MPIRPWRESFEPKTVEDAELMAEVGTGPPADLLAEAEAQYTARRRLEARTAARRLPRAYETLPYGSVPVHPLTDRLEAIERMSYQGLKPTIIAQRLGIELEDFRELALRYRDVELALTGGAARAADDLSATGMLEALEGGDGKMLRFWLERRHGFNPPPVVHPPSQVAPAVTINLPSPVGFARADELAKRQVELIEAMAIAEEDAENP